MSGVDLPLDSKRDGMGVSLGDRDVVSVLNVLDSWDGNVVDSWGSDDSRGSSGVVGDGSRGGSVIGDRREGGDLDLLNLGGLNLDLLDGGDGQSVGEGRGGIMDGGGGGSIGHGGSGGGHVHRGSGSNDGSDVTDGVDETILVDVLREAFKSQGPEAVLGGDKVTSKDGVNGAGHLSGGGGGGGSGEGNNSLHVQNKNL